MFVLKRPDPAPICKAALASLLFTISLSACSSPGHFEEVRISFKGIVCSEDINTDKDNEGFFSWNKESDSGITTGFSFNFLPRIPRKIPEEDKQRCRHILDAASKAADAEQAMVQLELEEKAIAYQEYKAESDINMVELEYQLNRLKQGLNFEFEAYNENVPGLLPDEMDLPEVGSDKVSTREMRDREKFASPVQSDTIVAEDEAEKISLLELRYQRDIGLY